MQRAASFTPDPQSRVRRRAHASRARASVLIPAKSAIVVPTISGVIGSVTGCSPSLSLWPMTCPPGTPAPDQIEK